MKKGMVKACAAAELSVGSRSVASANVNSLYIDMLCEKFKDRGIRTVGATAQGNAELYRKLEGGSAIVNAADSKYKSLNINGRSYMSSDDFAAYYKDLRDYKMPRFYSRAESEYEAAKALAEKNVQESGKPPKKLYGLL
ncbi:MAG: hypothetical protein E7649_01530 [Ruminococcaceae bacterium]|nr:hypothetical protein [Oscillospiraceae bacterium]